MVNFGRALSGFALKYITKMKNLKVTLVQTGLRWENRTMNLMLLEKKLSAIKKSQTDLIILPEMFTSGFTMNAGKVADVMNGETVNFMQRTASEKNSVICGSVVINEKNKYYNRLLWVSPDGKVQFYDKRHLFRMAGEHHTYSAGNRREVFEIKGWRICPLVCYDLRFPVWSRNKNEFDLLLYVANWPSRRRYAWKQLLIARAIENQCYVAGVNRIGMDGNNIDYSGDSVVLDALGKKINSAKAGANAVETVELNYKSLNDFRKKFPVMLDADDFKISKVVK